MMTPREKDRPTPPSSRPAPSVRSQPEQDRPPPTSRPAQSVRSRGRAAAPDSKRWPTGYRMVLEPRRRKAPACRAEPAPAPAARPEGHVTLAAGEEPAASQAVAAVLRPTYAPGEILAGRYLLIAPLGQGGMGEVWRARSLGLDVDVAVKLLRPDAQAPNAAERLRVEARAAARVAHPAAVRVLDCGVTGAGEPFLVMELLQGEPLSNRLADAGPLEPLDAVRLLLPVVGALAASHREGIVHRDLKPANILIVPQGRRLLPKLIDFGIASFSGPSPSGRRLTAHGVLVGTPVYAAPEQVRGDREPDPRTDVWAACTVLYELMTGVRPFDGPDRRTILRGVLFAPAACPGRLAAHPRLWRILARGLEKAPEARWPDMQALGRALAEWARACGATSDAAGGCLVEHWLDDDGVA